MLACKVVDLDTSWGKEAFYQEVRALTMIQGERNWVQFMDQHIKRQGNAQAQRVHFYKVTSFCSHSAAQAAASRPLSCICTLCSSPSCVPWL